MHRITNFLLQERILCQAEIVMGKVERYLIMTTFLEEPLHRVAVKAQARKGNVATALKERKRLLKDSPV